MNKKNINYDDNSELKLKLIKKLFYKFLNFIFEYVLTNYRLCKIKNLNKNQINISLSEKIKTIYF